MRRAGHLAAGQRHLGDSLGLLLRRDDLGGRLGDLLGGRLGGQLLAHLTQAGCFLLRGFAREGVRHRAFAHAEERANDRALGRAFGHVLHSRARRVGTTYLEVGNELLHSGLRGLGEGFAGTGFKHVREQSLGFAAKNAPCKAVHRGADKSRRSTSCQTPLQGCTPRQFGAGGRRVHGLQQRLIFRGRGERCLGQRHDLILDLRSRHNAGRTAFADAAANRSGYGGGEPGSPEPEEPPGYAHADAHPQAHLGQRLCGHVGDSPRIGQRITHAGHVALLISR